MNKNEYIQLLTNFSCTLRKRGFSIIGCDDNQLNVLEKKYGKLPEFYKIYLKFMGVDAGDFKAGTSICYAELDEINEETLALMYQYNIAPPADMFAFLMHQGYTSLLFTDRNNEDPEIYCYTECQEVIDIEKTFSACIEAEINEYLS
ncbi:hypothetical protein PSI19_20290 [Xenorhabdus khoisanae]|uniref:SMI1/KNR4 family protein n=1 Tax=Xenorhabdus khoisanae TaxID=880157 RepID=UPI0023591B78|nr:SMI1/KNR4 family protein [Xenorhabdus khoisanae]MDC9616148.1 hypothetical protein [Xenorhabdus khoisanae]